MPIGVVVETDIAIPLSRGIKKEDILLAEPSKGLTTPDGTVYTFRILVRNESVGHMPQITRNLMNDVMNDDLFNTTPANGHDTPLDDVPAGDGPPKSAADIDDAARSGPVNGAGSSTCRGMCKKFKAKRPPHGDRYSDGQVRCQTCSIYITTEGTGPDHRCLCCNIKVRSKPRKSSLKQSYHKKTGTGKRMKVSAEKDTPSLNTD